MNTKIKALNDIIYDMAGVPFKMRICPECGKKFKFTGTKFWVYKVPDGRGNYYYYCSYSCMRKNQIIKLTCKWCGKEFTIERNRRGGRAPGYCSEECRNIAKRERDIKRRIQEKQRCFERRKKHVEEMRNKLK